MKKQRVYVGQGPGKDFREEELVLGVVRSVYRNVVVDSGDAAEEKAMKNIDKQK